MTKTKSLQAEMVELLEKAGVPEKYLGFIDVMTTEQFDEMYNNNANYNYTHVLVYHQNYAVHHAVSLSPDQGASEKLRAAYDMYHFFS